MSKRSRRQQVWQCVALALVLLGVSGCSADAPEQPAPLFHLRGEIRPDEQWPARGSLTGDAELVAEVTQVVDGWQTPEGIGRYDSPVYNSIAWLGEVAGQVLAVVVFAPADDRTNRWVLEVTGQKGALAVTEGRDFRTRVTNMIEDTEVLPVRTQGIGPRYVVSAKVDRLTVNGEEVTVDDGLTEPVGVARCELVELVAAVEDRHLVYGDLGTGVGAPLYPLFYARGLGPEGITDVARLQTVDTCADAAPNAWLGSVRELFAPDIPAALSWGVRAELSTGGVRGTLEEVAIDGSSKDQRAIVLMWRPETGPPVLSTAQVDQLPPRALTFAFETAQGSLAVLIHPSFAPVIPFDDVSVPAEATILAAEPDIVVVAIPDHEIEISYTRDGEREQTTVRAP